jgi:hypothetical protein
MCCRSEHGRVSSLKLVRNELAGPTSEVLTSSGGSWPRASSVLTRLHNLDLYATNEHNFAKLLAV